MPTIDRYILRAQMGSDADVDILLRQLAPIFVQHNESCLEQLRAACAQGDLPLIGRLAHTMKGSAATLGATELSQDCESLCRCVQARNEDDVTRCIERVTASVEHVAQALSAYLSADVLSPMAR